MSYDSLRNPGKYEWVPNPLGTDTQTVLGCPECGGTMREIGFDVAICDDCGKVVPQ
jgi:hypothetical protein